MVVVLQLIGVVALVARHSGRIPENVPLDGRETALEFELGVHLIDRWIVDIWRSDRTNHVLPDVDRTPGGMFGPPTHEAVVVGRGMSDGPIELRDDIVHPALTNPEQDVGIQVVVVLQPAGVTAGHATSGRIVVVYAKRRYAELDPRFDAVHRVVQHFDEGVHVVSAPICAVVEAIAVGGVGCIVGNGQTCGGIGIEIVVDVQAVDVVTAHNIGRHIANVALVLNHTGIKKDEPVIRKKAVGV